MANRKGRRTFGNIRKLPSGKYQVRYLGPDGLERKAPGTFAFARDATAWLTIVESEIIKGVWSAPEAAEISLSLYGKRWLAERKLRPRTKLVYESIWKLHVAPFLGHLSLAEIRPATVRTWRTTLLREGRSDGMAARSYRLLRAMLTTAVKDDELLARNPCRIVGYDSWTVAERPTATIYQIDQLALAVPRRYQALIIVAGYVGLRWSELANLRRRDIDLDQGTIRVIASKSEAGVRTVALPTIATEALRQHVEAFMPEVDMPLFTGGKGAMLSASNWRRAVDWLEVIKSVGLPDGFHFHDLRHTSNNLAAAAGASTRELMHRMGHSTVRAALIYQHANSQRDREIADAIDARIHKQRILMAREWHKNGQEAAGVDEEDL